VKYLYSNQAEVNIPFSRRKAATITHLFTLGPVFVNFIRFFEQDDILLE
jgi:hypothetical protein